MSILSFLVLYISFLGGCFPKTLRGSYVNMFLREHAEVWMMIGKESIVYIRIILFVCFLIVVEFFPILCVFFQEHECKLTWEIVELIDREVDLMSREVKECNLEGLRKRICTLFLQYIKTPKFNPEVARILKVLFLFCSLT